MSKLNRKCFHVLDSQSGNYIGMVKTINYANALKAAKRKGFKNFSLKEVNY